MSKMFEAEVRCLVFARVWVEADSEAEARQKIQRGGGYWGQADFEKHTANTDEIESVKDISGDDE